MVKVSICIPSYSRLEYLKELVNACLSQTFFDFEICISQDFTPKGILPEIKNYCENLEKIHKGVVTYKAQNVNLGLAGNWNALVAMATGQYVFIPGDDDLIANDFLNKMLITDNLNADVIFCNQHFIDSNSHVLQEQTVSLNNQYKRDLIDNGIVKEPISVVLNNSVPMSAALIKREWFSKFSFDNLINTPELEFFLKIAIAGGDFVYVNDQLAFFRLHPASATNSGLTTGRYIANLITIEVPFKYEALKAHLIQKAIVPAINNAIKNGDKQIALKLFYSGYYPKNKTFHSALQNILLLLPNFMSSFLLKLRDL
jgi:glycosyltransferase involved in cell wall biosynthesis